MRSFVLQGLLFVALITILPEGICRLFIPKISHHKNHEKFSNLFPQIDNNTILIAGDSRMEWAVKPQLFNHLLEEDNLDYSSINLAMPGSNGLDVLSACLELNKKPKLILLGTGAFAPLWQNFQFDSSKLTARYSRKINREYFLRKYSYLYEQQSIKQFFKSKPPFFIDHNYDSKGGVEVLENGNYDERLNFQLKYFNKKSTSISDSVFVEYLLKFEELKDKLAVKNIPIVVIRMPLVEDLRILEDSLIGSSEAINYGFVELDYTQLYKTKVEVADSVIYQDGSHLSQEFAKKFTSQLYNDLSNKLN